MANNQNWVRIGFGEEADAFKGGPAEIEGMPIIEENPTSIILRKPMFVVKRINWGTPIRPYQGHDLFFKHLVARLLEELFLKEGKYSNQHIPIPLGSFNNTHEAGYYYKYAEGSEGFPFELQGDKDVDYRQISVDIKELNSFFGLFNDFGFSVENDIADATNGKIGKNIIMSEYSTKELYRTYTLHPLWKRIDFGSKSCPFDYDKFVKEMTQRESELKVKMGKNYSLALSSAEYYHTFGTMTEDEFKKFVEDKVFGKEILNLRRRYIW
jgi:hypothetical protein